MKPQELRIGNLMQEHYTGKVITVIELREKSITFTDSFIGKWQAEPIPLTEEILLNCGFKKCNDMDSWYRLNILNEWTSLNVNPKHKMAEIEINKHCCVLKFKGMVHQLQNLYFYLTAEELKIEL